MQECAIGEQNVIIEVFILGGQRIDQKRKKGWWRGRRERIEKGSRERIEIEFEEEDKEHQHLPLLVSRLDSAVKCCSSEVLKLSFQQSCSVNGLSRRD